LFLKSIKDYYCLFKTAMAFDQHMKAYGIVFFDGYCILCNSSVDLLLRMDRHQRLRFASMQSGFGAEQLAQCGMEGEDSIVFLLNGKAWKNSEAIEQICLLLPWPWRWGATIIRIFPRSWSDWVYTRVANSRYRWFGRRDKCRVPEPSEKDRFIQ
jgi:predicted DCC family thiol-disulfide oxidoreductase YuxK